VPVINWNTTIIDGREWLVVDLAKFRIPLEFDPESNMFLAIAVPDGGIGNFPALVQGDSGSTPQLDTVIDFTALAHDDPTPAYASLTETSPDIYQLNIGLHEGEPGENGDTVLDPADFSDVLPGKMIVVNALSDGFELQSPKIGDSYWPTSIANTPSGNSAYTLCTVGIPAQGFDWRPSVSGWCVMNGTGADVAVDLIARLDNASSGNIVGMAYGYAPATTTPWLMPMHTLVDGPPTNSADGYNKVLAGDAATIYLRAERRTGTETFTTSGTTTRFKVKVDPVP
jgi:hypothetical protein